jgi:hypothetical protein
MERTRFAKSGWRANAIRSVSIAQRDNVSVIERGDQCGNKETGSNQQ